MLCVPFIRRSLNFFGNELIDLPIIYYSNYNWQYNNFDFHWIPTNTWKLQSSANEPAKLQRQLEIVKRTIVTRDRMLSHLWVGIRTCFIQLINVLHIVNLCMHSEAFRKNKKVLLLLSGSTISWASSCIHLRNVLLMPIHRSSPRFHPKILILSLFEIHTVSHLVSVFSFSSVILAFIYISS